MSLPPLLFLGGIGIGAVEGNRGGVVVQLVDVDLELPDHMGGQRQDQRRDVAAEQAIEAPADAVIVERRQLTVAEPVRIGSYRAAHSPTP